MHPLEALLREPTYAHLARSRIAAAVEASGSVSGAALALRTTYRTLCRWRRSYPGSVPAGQPGRRVSVTPQVLQTNHDSAVIAKPRKKPRAPKTATSMSDPGDGFGRPLT